ncbi:hypothetical protein SAMN04488540_10367 [Ferrimonas sediminum]|uniref:Uncharacterized protein n=1 Tax=Ferrimonas sediminum TaxID=718193 RepID=A0A1G8NAE7_9GAMM|nr:hypothetical protein [Ferrimonas sediminum]SDI77138.1 hypothetical protein SAMN04488540_10367 [Ferrimonas sediminum]
MSPNPGKAVFLTALSVMASLLMFLYLQPRYGSGIAALTWLLPVVVGLALLLHHRRADRHAAPDHRGQDWSGVYQYQMKRVVYRVCPALVLFALSCALLALQGRGSNTLLSLCQSPPGQVSATTLALVVTLVGSICSVIVGLYRWARCPACGELPPGTGGSTGGVPLFLDHCPRCHATLSRAPAVRK